MNNLKKLGLTALASSLVAVGAQAGEVTLSGAANMVYKTSSDSEGVGLGTDKGLTVAGSGELDNGWTFALHTYISDAMAMSTHTTSLTMGSLGTVTAGSWGGNATSFDEEVPNAYEQTSDISNDGSSNRIGTFMGSGGLTWAPNSFDLGGASASVLLGWSPNGEAAASTDGGMPAKAGNWGTGFDAGVTISTDMGLTIGAYVAERENETPTSTTEDKVRDEFNGTWYATYSMGPVSVGYQHSYLDSGVRGSAEAATAAKAIRTAAGIFEETQMSISFNVNDNLSISYTDSDDEYNAQDNASTAVANVSEESEIINIAYTQGSLSIKAFLGELSNPDYDSNAAKVNQTEIAIGLAF